MGFKKAFDKIKEKITPSEQLKEDDWFNPQGEFNSAENLETDNWRWELEFSDIIDSYIHTLRKEKRNSKGQWKTLDNQKQYMNEEGIAFVISSLQPIMNKGTPMGSIDKKEANKTTNALVHAFKDKVLREHELFDIEKTNIPMLVWGFYNMVRMILTRSVNDGERKIRSKMFAYKDNYSHDEVSPDEISNFKL